MAMTQNPNPVDLAPPVAPENLEYSAEDHELSENPMDWPPTVWGHLLEKFVFRWNPVIEPADEWYYDGITVDGTPTEIKACRVFVGSGHRKGTWWIPKAAFEKLITEGGWMVLGVYDPERATYKYPFAAFTNVVRIRAEELESIIPAWFGCDGHHKRSDMAANLQWDYLIPVQDVPTAAEVFGNGK